MFIVFFVLLFLLAGCGGTDYPPELVSYGQSADTLQAGESAVFWTVAVDPDGDQVTYSWNASQGYFVDPEEDTVIWQSPENPAVYNVNIQVIITDATGLSFIKNFEIVLTSGSVQQDTAGNQPPMVVDYGQSLTKALLGEKVSFWIHAEDPEDDRIFYFWTASSGIFSCIVDSAVNWWPNDVGNTVSVGVIAYDSNGAMTSHVFQIDVNNGAWRNGSQIPVDLSGPGTVVLDGKIFVFGGNSHGQTLNTTYIYDPTTDTWTRGADMPTGRAGPAAAAYNGGIYVFGGKVVETNEFLNVNEVYDPASNTWETKTPMPTARQRHVALTVGDRIYVIGGFDGNQLYAINEVYDPEADKWETKTSMFTPRDRLAGVVYGGYIYCIGGGQSGFSTVDANERYDPKTDTWERLSPMPIGRRGIGYGVIGDLIIVFSGKLSSGDYTDRVDAYSISQDKWISSFSGKPTPCESPASATINDTIYLIGGWDYYTPTLSINEIFYRE